MRRKNKHIMESIRELFRIGNGPSSSHTMGPKRAAEMFLARHPDAAAFEVELYGSLAATGKGHLTDAAILSVLSPVAPAEIVWKPGEFLPFHPNGMVFKSFDAQHNLAERWEIFSVGGGALASEEMKPADKEQVYDMHYIYDIKNYCDQKGLAYWEYVEQREGAEIFDYLDHVFTVMCRSIEEGLESEGVLPGGLNVPRKASEYYIKAQGYAENLKRRGMLYSYALAVSEMNASGGLIVTAPTCGSSGVVPAVLFQLQNAYGFKRKRLLKALATAGLFGNVAKTNASISGAEVGCQGEVGVACAMAAAAATQTFGGSIAQIEYAAEMGLEHHLGLTCDPVCGLVQIPCIERNAFAAARAIDSNIFAMFSDGQHRVSYDRVVDVMKRTGHDLPSLYKETAEGGLAWSYNRAGCFEECVPGKGVCTVNCEKQAQKNL